MNIIDFHVHSTHQETENIDDLVRMMDETEIEVMCLFAPFLNYVYHVGDAETIHYGNEYLAGLIRDYPSRFRGFALVNPLVEGAPEEVEHAHSLGLYGLKMVPQGWYPYDDCALAVYERAEALDMPIIFHAGIHVDGRSGRFCRPTFYEAVRDFPNLRIVLAHIAWPWTDEAIAVAMMDLLNGRAPNECQIKLDLSFGCPPIYRHDVLCKALAVLGPEMILYGSDRFMPQPTEIMREAADEVITLLRDVGLDDWGIRRIMHDNAAEFLGV